MMGGFQMLLLLLGSNTEGPRAKANFEIEHS